MNETKHLHIIDVEPNTYLLYLDGELEETGDQYMKEDTLIDLLETDLSYEVTTEWMNPTKWKGRPQTIGEAVEMYDDVEGVDDE